MKRWIEGDLNNAFHTPPASGSIGKIIYTDVYIAQKTSNMNQRLFKCKTTIINVPRGTASRVQPLDVSINKLSRIVCENSSNNI